MRRDIGIWPPSKPGGTWVLALVPLVPRPAVLPLDPSPRPTRVLSLWAPGAGRRSCSFNIWLVHFLYLDQVADNLDHATEFRAIRLDHRLADPAQAERAQRVALHAGPADLRLDLG